MASLVLAASIFGCSTVEAPVSRALESAAERDPVILVPGISGTSLEEPSGTVLWGTGRALLRPRDRGYGIALPIAPESSPLAAARRRAPELEAPSILRRIRLFGVFSKPIYEPLVELAEANGYRVGDLERPRPGDTFFPFPYDWRRDNVRSAQKLDRALVRLREARGGGPLSVVLICQSNGAHICRYLAKYGGVTLSEAEGGRGRRAAGVRISKLVLIGTANGGSLRILREMDRGRTYIPVIGRHLAPETLFTLPALYQELPSYRSELFFGPDGETLPVDLFDAEAWARYGWSIFRPTAALRSDRRPDLFADEAERRRFLAQQLARARRFHRALEADAPGFGEPRYYLIQNPYAETPERALIERRDGEWKTWFSGDRRLKRSPFLSALAGRPGDGHATVASQRWLSAQESAALAAPLFPVRGGHFELILGEAAQRRLVQILEE